MGPTRDLLVASGADADQVRAGGPGVDGHQVGRGHGHLDPVVATGHPPVAQSSAMRLRLGFEGIRTPLPDRAAPARLRRQVADRRRWASGLTRSQFGVGDRTEHGDHVSPASDGDRIQVTG
jgi:hypothetical protein